MRLNQLRDVMDFVSSPKKGDYIIGTVRPQGYRECCKPIWRHVPRITTVDDISGNIFPNPTGVLPNLQVGEGYVFQVSFAGISAKPFFKAVPAGSILEQDSLPRYPDFFDLMPLRKGLKIFIQISDMIRTEQNYGCPYFHVPGVEDVDGYIVPAHGQTPEIGDKCWVMIREVEKIVNRLGRQRRLRSFLIRDDIYPSLELNVTIERPGEITFQGRDYRAYKAFCPGYNFYVLQEGPVEVGQTYPVSIISVGEPQFQRKRPSLAEAYRAFEIQRPTVLAKLA